MLSWHNLRDAALFLIGALGIAHEELGKAPEKPSLLLIYGACLGLPAFLRRDEKK